MHRIVVCLCSFALVVATSQTLALLHAQQAQPAPAPTRNAEKKQTGGIDPVNAKVQEPRDQIQLKARLVSLTVTVLDPFGRFVTGTIELACKTLLRKIVAELSLLFKWMAPQA